MDNGTVIARPNFRPSILVLLVFVPALIGCAEARLSKDREILSLDAFHMNKNNRIAIIDIRSNAERFQDGAADGALPIFYSRDIFFDDRAFVDDVDAAVGGDRVKPIALMCRRGVTSRAAQGLLLAEGFRNVYSVSDGFMGSEAGPGWKGWGLPVFQTDPH